MPGLPNTGTVNRSRGRWRLDVGVQLAVAVIARHQRAVRRSWVLIRAINSRWLKGLVM